MLVRTVPARAQVMANVPAMATLVRTVPVRAQVTANAPAMATLVRTVLAQEPVAQAARTVLAQELAARVRNNVPQVELALNNARQPHSSAPQVAAAAVFPATRPKRSNRVVLADSAEVKAVMPANLAELPAEAVAVPARNAAPVEAVHNAAPLVAPNAVVAEALRNVAEAVVAELAAAAVGAVVVDAAAGNTNQESMIMKINRLIISALLFVCIAAWLPTSSRAATAYELDRDSRNVLKILYAKNPKAVEIANQATAALVFPTIVKAGFIFGAHGGDGALISNGGTIGYYHTSAISYGLQAGVQKYGYVLFFMNHKALSYLDRSGGWEVGVGPSIVVVDTGAGKNTNTTTLQKDIYAFIFNQKGLMAGLGLQGSKITRYTPSK
jgi:lipid-binding SYLF domain-containing protein